MTQNRTKQQLSRGFRLDRSRSFSSYAQTSTPGLTFGQHFAQTANMGSLRPSPSSFFNSSTPNRAYTSSKEYGYLPSRISEYRSSSIQQPSYLEVRNNRSTGLQRHSSFNPSDYSPHYSAAYKGSVIQPKIELQPTLPSRRFTKCRRSSSLMSRYKFKPLRSSDGSPCILSIYVADPQKIHKTPYPLSSQEETSPKSILKKVSNSVSPQDSYEEEEEEEFDDELESEVTRIQICSVSFFLPFVLNLLPL